MSKYDAYDNELTRYIDMLTDISIKDIIGDLVGDIQDVDIPIDIPEGNVTISGTTPAGPLEIRITKNVTKKGFKKITTTNVTIDLEKGDSIYEEYNFELGEENPTVTVNGFILEERERGFIIMRNTREYDYNNREFILINMQEKRNAYNYQRLRDADIELENIDEEYKEYKEYMGFDKPLKVKHYLLKGAFSGYPIDDIIAIGLATNLNMGFPNYKKGEYNPKNQWFYIDINNFPKESWYLTLEGDKILERLDDLIHGNITHQSLLDLKTLLNATNTEFGNSSDGFNLIINVKATNRKMELYSTLESLEDEELGKSKNTLSREYYEYLRELVLDTFQVEIPENLESPNDIVQLLKSSNNK